MNENERETATIEEIDFSGISEERQKELLEAGLQVATEIYENNALENRFLRVRLGISAKATAEQTALKKNLKLPEDKRATVALATFESFSNEQKQAFLNAITQ